MKFNTSPVKHKPRSPSKAKQNKSLYCALDLTTRTSKLNINPAKPKVIEEDSKHSDLFNFLKEEEDTKPVNRNHDDDGLFDFLYEDEDDSHARKRLRKIASGDSEGNSTQEADKDDITQPKVDLNLLEQESPRSAKRPKRQIVDEEELEGTPPKNPQRLPTPTSTPKTTSSSTVTTPRGTKSPFTSPPTVAPPVYQPKRRVENPHFDKVLKRLDKALCENMRVTSELVFGHLERQYIVVGASGRAYTVVIRNQPTCSCPDNLRGKTAAFCKHILFVLVRQLGMKKDDRCMYKGELLSSELFNIFFPEDLSRHVPIVADTTTSKFSSLLEDHSSDVDEDNSKSLPSTVGEKKKKVNREDEHEEEEEVPVKTEPKSPMKERVALSDNRRGALPGYLNEFKPGTHTPKKPLVTGTTVPRTSPQEYLCRDCKRAFCRKGARDNHEKRLGHERWRKGVVMKLTFE